MYISDNTLDRSNELIRKGSSVLFPYDLPLMNNILGQNIDTNNPCINQEQLFASNTSKLNVYISFMHVNYVAHVALRNSNDDDGISSDGSVTNLSKITLLGPDQ